MASRLLPPEQSHTGGQIRSAGPTLSFCECVARLVVKAEDKEAIEAELHRAVEAVFLRAIPIIESEVFSHTASNVEQSGLDDAEREASDVRRFLQGS